MQGRAWYYHEVPGLCGGDEEMSECIYSVENQCKIFGIVCEEPRWEKGCFMSEDERDKMLGGAFSYRPDLSKESQEDKKIADDLYHELKKQLRQQQGE
jgi:hypothetical protein